jgi:GR25 family glycosyltransferase involved in LPS biosynthesis
MRHARALQPVARCPPNQDAPVSYAGIYINLDRSTGRRAAMESQLARHGLADRYQRFSAADGNTLGLPTSLSNSEMGCLISHYLVCRDNLETGKHLHVVEDDVMFSRAMDKTIGLIVASGLMDKYDILFLDTVVDPLAGGLPFREYKALYDQCIIRDERGNATKVNFKSIEYIATSTSYLLNCRSIKKILSVYDGVLAGGAKDAVDIMLRKKGQSGALRVGCLFPFLTSIRLDDVTSTITGRNSDDRSALAINLARHSFFIDCDMHALLDYAEKVRPPPATEPHYRLLSRLLRFMISPEFHKF